MIKTHEGGNQHEHSLDHALEFFSKAGSLFAKGKHFYSGSESALSLFQKTWIVDPLVSFKLLLWLRDCRGGAGNRSGFRECIKWLGEIAPDWVAPNLSHIPEVGRWDDLRVFTDNTAYDVLKEEATNMWATAIKSGNVLAAKWCDRKDFSVKHALGIKREGVFRRRLAKIRKDHIVEHKMSTNRWSEIEYHTVPSLAMARYANAFKLRDSERFSKFKEKVKSGEVKIKAKVLFPHDCVRTVIHGDEETGDLQFDALPNYLEGIDERIIVIADTSGSMSTMVSGSVEAVHVSQGMALYCSAKIPEDNPFHKKFMEFSREGKFKNWNGFKFSEAIHNTSIFSRAIGSTHINKALDLILKTAKYFNLTDAQMPTTLLIVSDMQFHTGGKYDAVACKGTEVKACLHRWVDAGYKRPKIVYWNVEGYAGAPDTTFGNNVALVSGFSPSVLKAVFSGKDMSPLAVMNAAIEKYDVVDPRKKRKRTAKKKAKKNTKSKKK